MGDFPNKATQFSKENQPENNGRPPKLLSTINAELKLKGYERVSPSQIVEAYELLFGLDEDKIKEYVTDKKSPMFLRIVAKQMLTPKGHEMIEKMLDRAHGKAKQSMDVDHTTKGDKIIVSLGTGINPDETTS